METTNGEAHARRGPFAEGARIRIADDVVSRCVFGETVMLRLETEEYFGLNGVGTRLWELVRHGTTFDDAVAVLADEYDADRRLVEADVHAVLTSLLASELVVLDADEGDRR